jgi:hypothetical protein
MSPASRRSAGRLPRFGAGLLLLTLAACAGSDDQKQPQGANESGEDTAAPAPPTLPAAACGLSHRLLPTEGMGALVSYERDPSSAPPRRALRACCSA